MTDALQFQLRITVSPERGAALRGDVAAASYEALAAVLRKDNATVKCQFDAFADYVSEAERLGTEQFPLYQWTKYTIGNPEKKARYLRAFTIYVNGDEVYDEAVTERLHAGLVALVGEAGIEKVSRFDTNPANNPQPPKR